MEPKERRLPGKFRDPRTMDGFSSLPFMENVKKILAYQRNMENSIARSLDEEEMENIMG